ncbi:MAG TPA: VOC family protein [Solirubrobacterales bacterium]|nr:VOC family protein [Solirubrobacterales bacterium]
MTAARMHHVALRVASLERAGAFYSEVFGARPRGAPFLRSGRVAEEIACGPPGVRFRMGHLELEGGLLELIEFEQPRLPARVFHPSEGNIVHLALQVADAGETLRRAEQRGGLRVWPELRTVAGSAARVIYLADPDENVIEAIEASPEQMLAAIAANG